MYAYHVTRDALLDSAARVGVEINATDEPERKRVRFTLKLAADKKYQKLNPNPTGQLVLTNMGPQIRDWSWHKTASVCFHGHYAFIDDVLDSNPYAVITSSRQGNVKYDCDNFEDAAAEYGDKRLGTVGNIYHNFRIRDTCECEK